MARVLRWPSATIDARLASDLDAMARSSTRRMGPYFAPKDMDMKKGIYHQRTGLSVGMVGGSIFVIGICLIRLAEFIPSDWPTWKPIVTNVGGLLIASVGLAIAWELQVKRAFVDEIFEAAKVASEIRDAKIVGVTTEFMTGVEWIKHIDSAKEMDILFFGGGTWRNAFDHKILELMKRPGARVNLILPNPHSAVVQEELSRRFGYSEEEVARRITESEAFFKELASKPGVAKGVLKVWHLDESPLFTFYRLDNSYVLTTYRHGGKGKIPTLVCYKGGSLADFVDEQIEAMIGKRSPLAKLTYPAGKPSDAMQIDTTAIPEDATI
jgi:hypothetical protein